MACLITWFIICEFLPTNKSSLKQAIVLHCEQTGVNCWPCERSQVSKTMRSKWFLVNEQDTNNKLRCPWKDDPECRSNIKEGHFIMTKIKVVWNYWAIIDYLHQGNFDNFPHSLNLELDSFRLKKSWFTLWNTLHLFIKRFYNIMIILNVQIRPIKSYAAFNF